MIKDMTPDMSYKRYTRIFYVILMLLMCGVSKAWADGITIYVEQSNGTFETLTGDGGIVDDEITGGSVSVGINSETRVVTLTVTPDADYKIKKDLIVVEKMIDPNRSYAPSRGTPSTSRFDVTGPDTWKTIGTDYTFTVPAEYDGAYVTVTFVPADAKVITSLNEISADLTADYELAADIDASDLSASLGVFTGTLDGKHFTIHHLRYPIFASTNGAKICNINFEDVDITTGDSDGDAGAITSKAIGQTRIYNCGILPTTTEYDADGNITNFLGCSIGGSRYVGSLVGFINGEARVINCFSYATITGGTYVGGIVGYNNVATTADATKTDKYLKTMVMNCMFYGDITGGTNKAPIYNGQNIVNKDANGVSNFNYFRAEASFAKNQDFQTPNCALLAETRFLQRFEFYRHLLNGHRELAAWWVTGNADDKDLIDKWVLEPSQIGSNVPLPILKTPGKYYSVVNYDADHATDLTSSLINGRPSEQDRNKGGKLGTLKVNIVMDNGEHFEKPTGATITESTLDLPITDKDPEHFNFNYYKVQLPYYNDVGTKNYTGDRVVTGWKITSINGGTAGTFSVPENDNTPADAPNYNFADRDCYNKDLYDVSGRIFNQGDYWDVPEGVTEITIKPYWAKAAYIADDHRDVVYNVNMNVSYTSDNVGGGKWITSGSTHDFKFKGETLSLTVYSNTTENSTTTTAISNAVTALSIDGSHSVYDYAIVLVGNYHQYSQNPNNGTQTISYSLDDPYTLMSIDLDCDNEPDYSYILRFDGRTFIHPLRVDFLNVPGLGMAQKATGSTGSFNFGIPKPRDWFEVTNTALFRVTQMEYSPYEQNKERRKKPIILHGGVIEQWVSTQGAKSGGNAGDKVTYYHLGDNVWFKEFHIGVHQDYQNPTPHAPVSVTGGDYDQFYLTGLYRADANNYDDNAECYINGGRFGIVAGAGMEGIGNATNHTNGNITWLIDNADIDEFYGGGINAAKPVQGNINTTIKNSYVKLFCGGPKFGDMIGVNTPNNTTDDRTVTTTATNCTFGTYFGAGYGGTSYSRRAPTNQNDKKNINWNTWVNSEYKQEWSSEYDGVSTQIDYQFIPMSGNASNVARIWVEYAKFSLATTNNVTSYLNSCTVTGNFYGGGSLGKVAGNATSTLTGCTIHGSAFGAGFSASIPTVEVMNTGGFLTEPYYYEDFGTYRTGVFPETVTYTWVKREGTVNSTATAIDKNNHILYTAEDLDALGTVAGNVTLTIDGNTLVEGNVFNADGTVKEQTGGVFGGGDASRVTGADKKVEVNIDATSEDHSTHYIYNVFGGGNNGDVAGEVEVKLGVSGNPYIKNHVFGGGNNANVLKNTLITIEKGLIEGNIYGGGNLGAVGEFTSTINTATGSKEYAWTTGTGVCNVTINDGTVGSNGAVSHDMGNVFGAGKGSAETFECEPAMVYKANVNINKGTVYGNVYGGGQIGRVENNTEVKIGPDSGDDVADIKGNVFGAGAGVATHGYSALVRGNTEVTVQGKAKVGLNVYGGGEIASVGRFKVVSSLPKEPLSGGTCTVTIIGDAEITGDVFGACKGVEPSYVESGDGKSMHMDNTNTMKDFADETEYLDFLKTLALTSNTNVTVDGNATINSSVYGGGQRGTSLGYVNVDIIGGTVNNDVYGGGALANTNIGNWQNNTLVPHFYEVIGLTAGTSPVTGLYTRTGDSEPYTYTVTTDATAQSSTTYYRLTDTKVNLTGGTIYGDVYGGGLGYDDAQDDTKDIAALVYGDVLVTVNGTQMVTHTTGDVVDAGRIFGANNIKGTPKGHVKVLVQKTTAVTEQEIDITAVFGGGNKANYTPYDTDDFAEVVINETTDDGHRVIVGNVFGGGNEAGIDASAQVDIIAGQIRTGVYGGCNTSGTISGNATVMIEGGTIGSANLDNENKFASYATQANIFGGGLGENTYVGGNVEVNIGKSTTITSTTTYSGEATIYGDVYGGGALGHVNALENTGDDAATVPILFQTTGTDASTTTVNLYKGNIYGDVYGGGLGNATHAAYVGGNVAVNQHEAKFHIRTTTESGLTYPVSGRIFGANNIKGSPKGHVLVHIFNTESALSAPNDYTFTEYSYEIATVFGGGNEADYVPTSTDEYTEVIIEGCDNTSIKDVYGGGNAAAVSASEVWILGAKIIDQVFGGGNGERGASYAAHVGYRSGTKEVYGTGKASTHLVGGTIHYVYGGSNSHGDIRTSAEVSMPQVSDYTASHTDMPAPDYCNTLNAHYLYGGGKEAEMNGSVTMILGCIEGEDNVVYGGARNANIKGGVNLVITSGKFKQIFGGNDQSGTIQGPITVSIEETGCDPIEIQELYLGGNQAAYSVYGYKEVSGNLVPQNETELRTKIATDNPSVTHPDELQALFEVAKYADPVLNVVSCTKIGRVFGGGLGSTAIIYGNPTVNINTIPGEYAELIDGDDEGDEADGNEHALGVIGGSYSFTENNTTETRPGGIYGGGSEANVYGNPTVNIGTATKVEMISLPKVHAVEGDPEYDSEKEADEQPMVYHRESVQGANIVCNVYGGGLSADVDGNTSINIGTKSYTTDGYEGINITGNVFGGGQGSTTMVTGSVAVNIGEKIAGTGGAADTYVGNATVTGNVYGGSALGSVNSSDNTNVTAGATTAVTLNAGSITGSVYGGGLGENDVNAIVAKNFGNTTVTITGGTVSEAVYGGANVNGMLKEDATVTISGGTIGTELDTNNPSAHPQDVVFGGGKGEPTLVEGNVIVNIGTKSNDETPVYAGNATIHGHIYGGSALGNTNASKNGSDPIEFHTTGANAKTTAVNLYRGTINGDVFGGGLGRKHKDAVGSPGDEGYEAEVTAVQAFVGGNTTVNLDGATLVNVFVANTTHETGRIFGCNNLNGEPKGIVAVNIKNGSAYSVYGGGNQAAYTYDDEDHPLTVEMTGGTVNNNVFGGGLSADVTGSVTVNIKGGSVYNDVYGGGALANTNTGNWDANKATETYYEVSSISVGEDLTDKGYYTKPYNTASGTAQNGTTYYEKKNYYNPVDDENITVGATLGTGYYTEEYVQATGTAQNGVTYFNKFYYPADVTTGADVTGYYTKTAQDTYESATGTAQENVIYYQKLYNAITDDLTGQSVDNYFIIDYIQATGIAQAGVTYFQLLEIYSPVTNINVGDNVTGYYTAGNYTLVESGTAKTNTLYYRKVTGDWATGKNDESAGTTYKTVVNLEGGIIGHLLQGSNGVYTADDYKGGNVYGGGLGRLESATETAVEAMVYGDIDVKVDGTAFILRLLSPGNNENNIPFSGRVFGCNNLNGTPKGNVKVTVWKTIPVDNGIIKDAHNENIYEIHSVYGGGNLASYMPASGKKTEVIIEDGCDEILIEKVFGGGNSASVPASDVKIKGSLFIGYAFGGGNGADRIWNNNGVWKKNGGAPIFGDASIIAYGGKIGQVFSGSDTKGTVYGNASVKLAGQDAGITESRCALRITNTYGAGRGADINGDVNLIVSGCTAGDAIERVFGGSYDANIRGDVNLTITSGIFTQVFGGNDHGGSIGGNINVNIEESDVDCNNPTIIRYLYGGGREAIYPGPHARNKYGSVFTRGKITVNVKSATRIDNVYGGSYRAPISGDTEVNIDMIKGNMVGKGIVFPDSYFGDIIPNLDNPTINYILVTGLTVHTENVEGSSVNGYYTKDTDQEGHDIYTKIQDQNAKAQEGVYYYKLSMSGTVKDDIGTIGNVYGGSFESYVNGSATINIGTKDKIYIIKRDENGTILDIDGQSIYDANGKMRADAKLDYAEETPLGAHITGNVYGGGDLADVGITYDESNNIVVNGYTAVNICAKEKENSQTHEYESVTPGASGVSIAGNIYGGGKGLANAFKCEQGMVGGTNVRIGNGTVGGSVYGGGQIGRVEENTAVTIGYGDGSADATKAPVIEGSVFGAGAGVNTHGYSALVRGKSEVTVQGNTWVKGSVYGGGEVASVGKYKVAANGMPEALYDENSPTSGYCYVTIGGYADIGPDNMVMNNTETGKPDDWGHVFGAGKGVLPYEKVDGNPWRMKPNNEKQWFADGSYVPEDNQNADYKVAYLKFIETLALATQTDVIIGGNAFVKGSVYGGSENGIVQHDTHVTIQDHCQIGQGKEITTRYENYSEGSIFEMTTPPAKPSSTDVYDLECDHWEYGKNIGTEQEPQLIYVAHDRFANSTGELEQYSDGSSTEGGRRIASDGHTFYGNVFGGGSGYYPYAPGKWHWNAGAVYGNTRVDITGGHILTNVYGGNEMTNVGSVNSDGTFSGGTCTVNFGGTATLGVPRTLDQIAAHPVTCYLFGAGKGDQRIFFNQQTNVNEVEVNITGGWIYGSAFGGGEDGHVLGDVNMTINENDYNPNNNNIRTKIGTWGTSYVDGNVFGGGRGFGGDALTAGAVCGNVYLTIESGTILGSVYGGGRLGAVGTYLAPVSDTQHYGKPIENGVQQVINSSTGAITTPAINNLTHGQVKVTISGGTIGNTLEYIIPSQDDATTWSANQWKTWKDQNHIPNTEFEYDDVLGLYRLLHTKGGNVFAGSMGRLYALDGKTPLTNWADIGMVKSTTLEITGGKIYSNVYGGGELAKVAGYKTVGGKLISTDVTINISGSDESNYIGTEVKEGNDVKYTHGCVFGGGYGSSVETLLTPEEEHSNTITEEPNVPRPKTHAGIVEESTNVLIQNGLIRCSVFGGGEVASVKGNTYVSVSGGTIGKNKVGTGSSTVYYGGLSMGNVYGGGKGIKSSIRSGQIYGNTKVEISGSPEIYHNVYGGGAFGSVGTFNYTKEYDQTLGTWKATAINSCTTGTGTAEIYITGGTIGTDGNENGMIFGSSRGDAGAPGSIDDLLAWVNNTSVIIGDTTSNATGSADNPTIYGSVYGGGENGHNLHHAYVHINGGTIGVETTASTDQDIVITENNTTTTYHGAEYPYRGNVYGAGCGTDQYYENNIGKYNPLSGIVQGNTKINITSGHIVNNVYGGGAMGSVGKITNFDDLDNTVDYSYKHATIKPEADAASGEGAFYNFGISWPYQLIYDKTSGLATINITGIDTEIGGHVYGAARGEVEVGESDISKQRYVEAKLANVRETKITIGTEGASSILQTPVINGSVYGGGEDGHVYDDASVTIHHGKIAHSVFGGGKGEGTFITTLLNATGSNQGQLKDTQEEAHSWTAGRVYGNTYVTMNGGSIGYNLYGGGNLGSVGKGNYAGGYDDYSLVGYGELPEQAENSKLWGTSNDFDKDDPSTFTKMADYFMGSGFCYVNIYSGTIGSASGVDEDGHPYGNVYGSSRGKAALNVGRLSPRYRYTPDFFLGYSNETMVTIGDGDETHSPKIFGSVYGGGQDGHVRRHTHVIINNGKIGTENGGDERGNIFGAGSGLGKYTDDSFNGEKYNNSSGSVTCKTIVDIKGGIIYNNVYGGGALASVGPPNAGQGFDEYNTTTDYTLPNGFTTHPNVTEHASVSYTEVNINGGNISGDVYGASRGGLTLDYNGEDPLSYATDLWSTVNVTNGEIGGNVFGGGEAGLVKCGVEVNILGGTIAKDVYGGGALANTNTSNWGGYANYETLMGVTLVPGESDVTGLYTQSLVDNRPVYTQITAANTKAAYNTDYYDVTWANGMLKANATGTENYTVYNTRVNILGGTIGTANSGGDIYGGGLGRRSESGQSAVEAIVYGDVFVNLNGLDAFDFDNQTIPDYLSSSVETPISSHESRVSAKGAIVNRIFGANNLNGSPKGHIKVHVFATQNRDKTNLSTKYAKHPVQGEKGHEDETLDEFLDRLEVAYPSITGISDKIIAAKTASGDYNTALTNYNTASAAYEAIAANSEATEQDIANALTAKETAESNLQTAQETLTQAISNVYALLPNLYDVQAVYGGGNLAAYVYGNGEVIRSADEDNSPANQAKLASSRTEVIIDGCGYTSIKQVYGGGNAASVPGTYVAINGTYEIDEVFGGGNGEDNYTLNNGAEDKWYENPGANVGYKNYTHYVTSGNDAQGTGDETTPYEAIDNDDALSKENRQKYYRYGSGIATTDVRGGTIHAVFGGSNKKGNISTTALSVYSEYDDGCELIINKTYGGGKDAPMDGTINLSLDCVKEGGIIYGGADNADIYSDVTLNITNGKFDKVIGGNNIGGALYGTITINVEEKGCTPIEIKELYGGGYLAPYSIYGYEKDANGDYVYYEVDDDNKFIKEENGYKKATLSTPEDKRKLMPLTSEPSGAQYANDPAASKDLRINIISATSIDNLYGGGYKAMLVGSPYINVNMQEGKKQVYPTTINNETVYVDIDYNKTNTKTDYEPVQGLEEQYQDNGETKTKHFVYLDLGNIGTIYGGGYLADVVGDTHLDIGTGEWLNSDWNPETTDTDGVRYTYENENSDTKHWYKWTQDANGVETGTKKRVESRPTPSRNAAQITGDVFGGGDNADVTGNTNITIGDKEYDNEFRENRHLHIDHNVYGGGNMGSVGTITNFDDLDKKDNNGNYLYRHDEIVTDNNNNEVGVLGFGLSWPYELQYNSTGTTTINIYGGRIGISGKDWFQNYAKNDDGTDAYKTDSEGYLVYYDEIAKEDKRISYKNDNDEDVYVLASALSSLDDDTYILIKDNLQTIKVREDNGDVYGGSKGNAGGLIDEANKDRYKEAKIANVRETYVNINLPTPTDDQIEILASFDWDDEDLEDKMKYALKLQDGLSGIAGSVYGGGEDGHVYEDTHVNITGGFIGHGVYGGGKGKGTYQKELLKIEGIHNPYTADIYSIVAGRVYGNTNVTMDDGYVMRNIYGGGNLGSVGKGNYASGTDDFYPDGYGERLNGPLWDNSADNSVLFLNSGKSTVKINGGQVGFKVSDNTPITYTSYTVGEPDGSKVSDNNGNLKDYAKFIKKIMFKDDLPTGNVFGGSRGTSAPDVGALTPRYKYAPDFYLGYVNETDVIIGNTTVSGDGPLILGSVYGGGQDGHVRRDAKVTVNKGIIGLEYSTVNRKLIGTLKTGANQTDIDDHSDFSNDQWLHRGNVYGSGSGIGKYKYNIDNNNKYEENVTIQLSNGKELKETYYGTSAGSVTRFTTVDIKGGINGSTGIIYRNVYGGGSFSSIGPPKIPGKTTGDPFLPTDENNNNGPGKQTLIKVDIAGTIGYENSYTLGYGGNVYGASRGDKTLDPTSFATCFFTEVNVTDGANVLGSVFGGGELGLVKNNTNIKVEGTDISSTTIGYDIFGGGEQADVNGNTNISITGGHIKHNVYGGGNQGSVGTITNLANIEQYKHDEVASGEANKGALYNFGLSWPYELIYAKDANGKTLTGNTVISISGNSRIGTDGDNDGDVFGASKGAVAERYTEALLYNVANTSITIELPNSSFTGNNSINSIISVRKIYDEDENSEVDKLYINDDVPCIAGSVYGGGEDGHVYYDTNVKLENGLIGHAIYGGGKGKGQYDGQLRDYHNRTNGIGKLYDAKVYSIIAGRVYGNTNVTMEDGYVMRNIYGGGNLGSVGIGNYSGGSDDYSTDGYGELPPTNNQSLWNNQDFMKSGISTVTIEKGTIGYICTTNPSLNKKSGLPTGNVFGGCRGMSAPNYNDISPRYEYFPEFFFGYVNDTRVNIGTEDYGPTILGSVYGGGQDGHVRRDAIVTINNGNIGTEYNDANRGYLGTKTKKGDNNTTVDVAEREDLDHMQWRGRGNVYAAGSGTGEFEHKWTETDGEQTIQHTETGYNYASGSVTGVAKVEVNNGTIYQNVYGGGSLASIGPPPTRPYNENKAIEVEETVNNEKVVKFESADKSERVSYTASIIKINGGQIGYDTNSEKRYGGNVYGASRGDFDGSLHLNIPALYASTVWTEVKIGGTAHILNNVFGGGESGSVKMDTYVEIGGKVVESQGGGSSAPRRGAPAVQPDAAAPAGNVNSGTDNTSSSTPANVATEAPVNRSITTRQAQ